MKKPRFTESQIFSILKEGESGQKTANICRGAGQWRNRLYYNWKAKYGDASVSIIKRVKDLSHDLSQYKRTYAEKAFEREALRDLIEKSSRPRREKRSDRAPDGKPQIVQV